MKKLLLIILANCIMFSAVLISAEGNTEPFWKIVVDEKTGIECENAIVEYGEEYYIDFTVLLEAMGSTVQKEKEGLIFSYSTAEYIAQIRPLFSNSEEDLYIGISKWIVDEKQHGDDLYAMLELGDDRYDGEYVLADDALYISFDTCYHLLYELGCSFKVDYEKKFIQISLNTNNPGELYINDKEVDIEDEFLMIADEIDGQRTMFVPFRAIMEAAGATVHWEEETGNIIIKYDGNEYVCIKHTDDEFLVCDKRNLWKSDNDMDKYLEMHTGVEFLPYCIVKDRTYLPYVYFRGFLEAIGCKTEISMGARTVKIWTE